MDPETSEEVGELSRRIALREADVKKETADLKKRAKANDDSIEQVAKREIKLEEEAHDIHKEKHLVRKAVKQLHLFNDKDETAHPSVAPVDKPVSEGEDGHAMVPDAKKMGQVN